MSTAAAAAAAAAGGGGVDIVGEAYKKQAVTGYGSTTIEEGKNQEYEKGTGMARKVSTISLLPFTRFNT
jgi:hypothetical protein